MLAEHLDFTDTKSLVGNAVGASAGLQKLQDKIFARLFHGLVYAQIWEDPLVDMEAMEISPSHHIVTIASGGCNALSYLTANPAKVTAADLSPAHVALVRLKLAGAAHLPDWQSFYRFFGESDSAENISDYHEFLAPRLDAATRHYWESRGLGGRRRISGFARNIYRRGLLGRFIGAGHLAARLHGVKVAGLLACETLEAQRAFFDAEIAPLFSKPLIRGLTRSPLSLFGLGIPPAQFTALAGERSMAEVLKDRLERLSCAFPVSENYFAWQAFGRAYAPEASGALPPYLQQQNFGALRRNASRMSISQANLRDVLEAQSRGSVDRVVLLDAQDWMTDEQLNTLWSSITRVAAKKARVIFRTAGEASILPGRLNDDILSYWTYDAERSAALHGKDRSSIYGGFHIYELNR